MNGLSWLFLHLVVVSSTSALKILLTNDDGIASDGLQTLKTALRDAGHQVVVYAPSNQQSGSGAGLTAAAVRVVEEGFDEYSVEGSPATGVLIGLADHQQEENDEEDSFFDLVVSGTNNGNNGGPQVIHSGTVGAARTGMTQGIFSIAVATNPPFDTDDENLLHFQDAATLVVELVHNQHSGCMNQ